MGKFIEQNRILDIVGQALRLQSIDLPLPQRNLIWSFN